MSPAPAKKTPTLIRRIDQDPADGHTAVIQIVSTGEALMEVAAASKRAA